MEFVLWGMVGVCWTIYIAVGAVFFSLFMIMGDGGGYHSQTFGTKWYEALAVALFWPVIAIFYAVEMIRDRD